MSVYPKNPEIIQLAAAQLNVTVGDTAGNLARIMQAVSQAKAQGMDIVVFPELVLSGYPPEDLLYRHAYLAQINEALDTIMEASQGIVIVVGHPLQSIHAQYNALSVFAEGECISSYRKHCLPNKQVFDERRYFEQGKDLELVTLFDRPIAFLICEDVWHDEPILQAKAAGAELIVAINASPFHARKMDTRYSLMKTHAVVTGLPLIYVNMVGGQDELVFDGGSFAMNAKGEIVSQAPIFEEVLWPITLSVNEGIDILPQTLAPLPEPDAQVYEALVMGVRDYYLKNHFKGIILGLSGGIDSALTLAIAVDAVGADQVEAFLLPSRYTSNVSNEAAIEQCERMGVAFNTLSIEKPFAGFLDTLTERFVEPLADLTQQNLQARCRGVMLMAISNQTGHLLLTTGNKSEYAVGYATLYGDMCGGYAPLKDVYKTDVYRLVAYRNRLSEVIPEVVVTRPPSAELAPDQKDSDSLPAYDVLDAILHAYIEDGLDKKDLLGRGHDPVLVDKVITLLYRNEYKRRQSPPGPKVSVCAFGRERRYPITSGFKE